MAYQNDIRAAMADVRAFIVYRLEPKTDAHGHQKLDKIPTSPATGRDIDATNPAEWMLPAEATLNADLLNVQAAPAGVTGYGVGVIVSENIVLPNGRRLFALDIDKCRDGASWAPHAAAFVEKLRGGGVEVSVSGNGLHVYGTYTGDRPEHGTRNKTYGLELYSKLRFIACTGINAAGDPTADLTHELQLLARDYFPPHDDADYGDELTTAPVAEWTGPADDDELIRRAMQAKSGAAIFGGKASFADLWHANVSALAKAFPPQQHGNYDASAADQALANHLSWWTGNHGERIERLMRRSDLVRAKWDRPGYLLNTIQRACGSQKQWYKEKATKLNGHAVVATAARLPETTPTNVSAATAAVVETLASVVSTPAFVPHDSSAPIEPGTRPPVGDTLTVQQQIAAFDGYVYVQDIHQILTPKGDLLGSERFDTEFAGYTFITTLDGQRPVKRAWDAFIFSEIHSFPKVKGLFFDPRVPSHAIMVKDRAALINSYVPSIITRKAGDISPFLTHLYKLLPHGDDAQILLSYFAACVQYAGEKFQWWPLLQGVEGNGKTTLSYLLEYAVGERYTHWPKAAELGSKFNSAFYGKLLICCEDVYISEARGSLWESLKPMITGAKLEIEGKGVDKVTREVCFNGVMNTNHKNAIRKTANDRRICPFFCAQQSVADLVRDGMTVDYFEALREWRLGEGRYIVADYLQRFQIPHKWNPAKRAIRAPDTTATHEAISAGHGVAEQEVLEAIAQGSVGFRGGWISSSALDRLLAQIGKQNSIPRNRRREILETLGYILHPALPDGRSTIADTDGSRPYLYVMPSTRGFSERDPKAILGYYQKAQTP